jgi:hypothetical protein
VARDERSSVVFVPLLDRDPSSGRALDPLALSARVGDLRARLEGSGGGVALHVVGLAQLAADLDAGVKQVSVWCAAAALVAAGLILAHTRCARSTILIASCSLVAVVWQAGLVAALGLALDPFSVLVPFLIFALGLSHGAQKMNGVLQDVGRGADPLTAARLTFRRLFGTGLVALLTDAVGFAALAAIDIPVVRRLSLTAGLGVAALVVTNLVLLPVLLSFTGVSPAAAARSARAGVGEGSGGRGWRLLAGLTGRRRAAAVLVVAAVLVAVGLRASLRLEVGDVSRGASELRASSRYNRDVAFVAEHHDLAGDRFAVIVRTASDGCAGYRTLVEADRLAWALRQLPAVRTTTSLPDAVRQITAGTFEGSPKWLTLSPQQDVLDNAVQTAMARNPELVNAECSVTPVVAWLRDHRAESLDEVVRVASDFAARHRGEGREFLLAAGDAGFQAATNLAVRQAGWGMTVGVYAAVVLLCQAAFRSWRAVLVTMVPLAATSVLCAALMASLGIGVKVATLPVIALGVGIPDHALYLLSVQLAHQRAGLPLAEAHRRSLRFTGRAVALVSLTLACGVAAWAFSPIRMQADMGLLLAFMFVGSMVGALVLIPALSPFLLAGIGKEGGGR